uniref:Adaptor related protein complex 3 subunit sigma 1 n=1 Tax=Equus caballus TaxID=9796 RepID=A0A3Q2HPU4_HORSE
MAFWRGTQVKGGKVHFLSPDCSETTSGTGPALNFASSLPSMPRRTQSKPPTSAQNETALKITFFFGVAGRLLCSRRDCSGRGGLRSGRFWGNLRRSFAISRSRGRKLQRGLRLLSHLARWKTRAEVVGGAQACSGRALRQGASLRKRRSRETQPNRESRACRLVLFCRTCCRPLTVNAATTVFPQQQASARRLWASLLHATECAGAPPASRDVSASLRVGPVRAPPLPGPAPQLGGARARARGGGWGRIAGEIPRRGSLACPRPGRQRPPGRPGSAMIKAILIFNNHGKPRLSKFYQPYSEDTQQQIIRETFHLVSKRDENVCNFLEGGLLIGGSDNKLIYRHYATLYFVFCVDSSESELGILDLIQVFVETLDKCFENVCELDLIFHVDKVHNILAEMVMGGMVLETNMNEIVTQIDAQNKLEKSEPCLRNS